MRNQEPVNGAGTLNRKKRNDLIFFITLVVLPLTQFFLFYICVNANSILLSLKEYDVITGETSFVWLKNFKNVFYEFTATTLMPTALKNSLIAWVVNLFVGIVLGMIFSYYIFKKMLGSNFFKVLLFMPSIVSSLVMVVVFRQFVEKGLPAFAGWFGVEMQGLLGNNDTYFGTILFYNIWVGFGTQILMFLGAMNNISDGVLEAAKIDGASFVKEFIFIVVPLVWSTFEVFVTVSVVQIFTNQLNLFSFEGANAQAQFYTLGYYLYRGVQTGRQADYPMLSALGLICTLFAIPLTYLAKFVLRKIGPKEV